MLNWADWVILAILLISTALSLGRGFVREILSLVTWLVAVSLSFVFYQPLAVILEGYIQASKSILTIISFAVLFISTLIAGGLVAMLIKKLIHFSGLSTTDRILGMGFGLLRGGLLVLVVLLVLNATPVNQDNWWNESAFIPHFLVLEDWSREMASKIGDLIWATQDKLEQSS